MQNLMIKCCADVPDAQKGLKFKILWLLASPYFFNILFDACVICVPNTFWWINKNVQKCSSNFELTEEICGPYSSNRISCKRLGAMEFVMQYNT